MRGSASGITLRVQYRMRFSSANSALTSSSFGRRASRSASSCARSVFSAARCSLSSGDASPSDFEAVLQIMDSAFFLRIVIPCFASVPSHIQIGGNHIAQRVIIRTVDDLLAADRLAHFIQPSTDAANGCRDRRNCRPCPCPQIPFDRNRGRGRGSARQSVRAAKQRASSAPSAH